VKRLIQFSPQAISDLRGIYDYIAPRGGAGVAEEFVSRIYQHCLDMRLFPERGTRRDDLWPGLRLVSYRRQVTIAVAVTETELRVIRILGRGRDVEAAFSPESDA
jgi:toxin ParE1/3/4